MVQKRILITDDEPDLLEILEAVIDKPDWEIVTTGDGKTTIEQLEHNDFDLIILDLLMPEPDGFEVLKWIRKTKRTKELPVVVISAYCHDTTIETVMELGANHFLKKPIGFSDFKTAVNRFVLQN
tara:strand:- start:3326 stop:3700 length:375 start_codon:yes stop_codon:yes gene_type:complete